MCETHVRVHTYAYTHTFLTGVILIKYIAPHCSTYTHTHLPCSTTAHFNPLQHTHTDNIFTLPTNALIAHFSAEVRPTCSKNFQLSQRVQVIMDHFHLKTPKARFSLCTFLKADWSVISPFLGGMQTYTHTYTHTHTHARTHARTHTCTHTHTHLLKLSHFCRIFEP